MNTKKIYFIVVVTTLIIGIILIAGNIVTSRVTTQELDTNIYLNQVENKNESNVEAIFADKVSVVAPNRGSYYRSTETSYDVPQNIDLLNATQVEKEKQKVEIAETKKTINKSFYVNGIQMPKEHQEFLYQECKKQSLEFDKIMAMISLESGFNSQSISGTNDYGYMQINRVNHNNLSKTLGTLNKPLDPYINIKWGTHMLGTLYSQWGKAGINSTVLNGEVFSQLDKYVMSSYNKGVAGFRKYGMASQYISFAEVKYKELYS